MQINLFLMLPCEVFWHWFEFVRVQHNLVAQTVDVFDGVCPDKYGIVFADLSKIKIMIG